MLWNSFAGVRVLGVSIHTSTTVASRHAIAPERDGTVADGPLADPVLGLEPRTVIPDPASRFVKRGAGHAQQSHEEDSVVEPVGGGPHAGEAPEFDMQTLRNIELD